MQKNNKHRETLILHLQRLIMPTKLKPSVKHWDRKTGKTTVEHFYMKNTKLEVLLDIINSERSNPKLRIKCKRELDRRANVKRR